MKPHITTSEASNDLSSIGQIAKLVIVSGCKLPLLSENNGVSVNQGLY